MFLQAEELSIFWITTQMWKLYVEVMTSLVNMFVRRCVDLLVGAECASDPGKARRSGERG